MRHIPLILTLIAAPVLILGLATADVTPNRDFNTHFTPDRMIEIEAMLTVAS
ncbi:MAG: hypothetical protein WBA02_01860 [Jannaschia helgolandensis]|jgi:hypothetical protein|uniref:Uncharacterized protein n=1 Tax=Jannaschia helgolandensis TaxID=188906 RepID=A0A1H7N4I6_9RHOB|nr:hypothetical protein [Jannaschia helgolandensis]SEL18231.1 hypothetical protein SAMN04488526_2161 [Jannaschia helgolandensis]|tara:strand:- start:363 stop:518 length:156 start_codon:yes stop_codon:yes gene_type:complete